MLTAIIIYCVFSYFFVFGFMNSGGVVTFTSVILSPLTFPFILGQMAVMHQATNQESLKELKRQEAARTAKEKEKKAFDDKIKKAFENALEELTKPKRSGFAKEFNDMMNGPRNPFGW